MWLLRKKKSLLLKQSVWKKNKRICQYQLNLFPGFSSLLYWIVLKLYWIQTIFSECYYVCISYLWQNTRLQCFFLEEVMVLESYLLLL